MPPFAEAVGAGVVVSLWNRFVMPWVTACVATVVEHHEDLSSETSACSGEILHH